ncbi:MAG: NAD-dependent epimerase/dehydratase family protein, partial [Desulfomonilaceae bacterium]
MENVMITGVSGYLGMRLAQALSGHVRKIVGIDVQPPSQSENFIFCQMDIRDAEIETKMAEHEIDTVFHLAFVVRPIHNKELMRDISLYGSKNILVSAFNARVKQCVVISSSLAYGAHPDNPEILTEEAPLRGNEAFPYGHYKAVTDIMVQDFARENPNMIITILRPCTVLGPNIDNYVSRLLFMPVVICVRGSDPRVQFVHEDDFVNACVIAAEKKVSGAFNIAGDGVMTVSEIAERLGERLIAVPAALMYPVWEVLWRLHCPGVEVNSGYLDYARYSFVVSNQKAKELLGFYPAYSSLETLDAT